MLLPTLSDAVFAMGPAEFTLPLRYTHAYETWPDMGDNVWVTDHFNNCIIRFDPKTQKATYNPYPEGPHWSVPKIEVDKDNTIWFGSRFMPHITAVHFYPNGYSGTEKPCF